MKFKKLALSVAISSALVLAGCGGGGSDSSSGPVTLSGTAAKGIIQNGEVTAYQLIEGQWIAVGTATTDLDGHYSLELTGYQGGPVRLEVKATNGTTMKCDTSSCGDKAFGESVALSESFSMGAVLPQVADSSISDVPITPYTHMAAARVLADSEITAATVQNAIGEVTRMVGFNVSTTKVVDITEEDSLTNASVEEQRAAVLGAAVLKLTSNSKAVEEVLTELASTFEDGSFDDNDEIQVTELLGSWEQALTDEQVSGRVEDSVKTDIGLQADNIELETDEAGSYAPEASANTGDTDVAKAKALISDTRSLINNIAATDFDTPLTALDAQFAAAAEVFDRDAAAIMELAGVGLEQLFMTLETEGETLSSELQDNGNATRTVAVELDGQSVGDLTLAVTSSNGLSVTLSGELTGTATDAKTVSFDNLTLSSNLPFADLFAQSTELTTYTFAVSGGLSDGSTSLAFTGGELTAKTEAPISPDAEPSVISLSLDDLTLALAANGATFTGTGAFTLIKPDASKVSLPLYDDMPLTLSKVSLNGAFTASTGASLTAGIGLELLNSDKFDLLAFLNQESWVEVSLSDSLTSEQIAALESKILLVQQGGQDWDLSYGTSIYDYYGGYAWSYGYVNNSWQEYQENYTDLSTVVDPAVALAAAFTSIDSQVTEAWLYLNSEGENELGGQVELGSIEESEANFLQAKLTASATLTGLEGLPSINVSAAIERNALSGGEATFLLAWDGEQYTFTLEEVDVEAGTGKLTVSNPDGVSLTLTDLAESDTSFSGALYIGEKKVADVETLDSGLVKVSYIDGTFETIQ